jgi:hypothetical protein
MIPCPEYQAAAVVKLVENSTREYVGRADHFFSMDDT